MRGMFQCFDYPGFLKYAKPFKSDRIRTILCPLKFYIWFLWKIYKRNILENEK